MKELAIKKGTKCNDCKREFQKGDEFPVKTKEGHYLCHNCSKVGCEVYSRVVGYITPMNRWNEGKKAEREQLKEYKLDEKK